MPVPSCGFNCVLRSSDVTVSLGCYNGLLISAPFPGSPLPFSSPLQPPLCHFQGDDSKMHGRACQLPTYSASLAPRACQACMVLGGVCFCRACILPSRSPKHSKHSFGTPSLSAFALRSPLHLPFSPLLPLPHSSRSPGRLILSQSPTICPLCWSKCVKQLPQ